MVEVEIDHASIPWTKEQTPGVSQKTELAEHLPMSLVDVVFAYAHERCFFFGKAREVSEWGIAKLRRTHCGHFEGGNLKKTSGCFRVHVRCLTDGVFSCNDIKYTPGTQVNQEFILSDLSTLCINGAGPIHDFHLSIMELH